MEGRLSALLLALAGGAMALCAVGCATSEFVGGDFAADDAASDAGDGEATPEAEPDAEPYAEPDTEPDTEPDMTPDETPDGVDDDSGADADADADADEGVEPEAEADAESDEGSCVREEHAAEPIRRGILLLQDRSASMVVSGWWSDVVTGVTTFLAESGSDGFVVGLQYFPVPPRGPIPFACSRDAECGAYGPCGVGTNVCAGSYSPGTSCMTADYATPAVGFAELPGGASALLASYAAATATGEGTPLQPALEGVMPAVRAAAAAGRASPLALVIITDGEPDGCTFNTVAGAAVTVAAAFAATPSVATHVIGLGPVDVTLAPIAAAGGTGTVQRIDAGADVATRMGVALRRIRGPRECRYEVPAPSSGPLDADLVGVELDDPASPGDPTVVPRVAAAASCDASAGGWYFEDAALPGPILLCPASCTAVLASALDVTIVLECPGGGGP